MKPAAFSYHRPHSLDHVLALLAEHGFDAKLIAGGQSLAPMMNMRFAQPAHLIDLNGVPQLDGVRLDGATLVVGALTRHHALATDPLVASACPLLAEAAATIGHYAIRQRGTLGGSLANADPAAQLPLVARTLDAVIDVSGPGGARDIPAADFFVAALTTTLEPDEIVTAVRFPCACVGDGHAFELFSRRHGDFAIAACAVTVTVSAGCFERLRLGVGGIADAPLALDEVAAEFAGARADAAVVERIAARVASLVEPVEQPGISVEYRRELVEALIARALTRAVRRALNET
ncbi:MAG TPA: xanthine dehydrogenase family protein subunit M [Paraburkholderia sp.]|jgi:CO/xanthine dehydrogenase FAD-binding subunit|nr:xanthine dehydrogenase family protein subunit M [Paraburkholderia sp.]